MATIQSIRAEKLEKQNENNVDQKKLFQIKFPESAKNKSADFPSRKKSETTLLRKKARVTSLKLKLARA